MDNSKLTPMSSVASIDKLLYNIKNNVTIIITPSHQLIIFLLKENNQQSPSWLSYDNNLPRLQQLQCVDLLLQQFDRKKNIKNNNKYLFHDQPGCRLPAAAGHPVILLLPNNRLPILLNNSILLWYT